MDRQILLKIESLLFNIEELTITSHRMSKVCDDFSNCVQSSLYTWNDEIRFQLQCELDAAFFHLYGIDRDDVEYIMETFPIVKRKDETKWESCRTRDTILEYYVKLNSDFHANYGIEKNFSR